MKANKVLKHFQLLLRFLEFKSGNDLIVCDEGNVQLIESTQVFGNGPNDLRILLEIKRKYIGINQRCNHNFTE